MIIIWISIQNKFVMITELLMLAISSFGSYGYEFKFVFFFQFYVNSW